jgi:hypothetical protein
MSDENNPIETAAAKKPRAPRKPKTAAAKPVYSMSTNEKQFSNGRSFGSDDEKIQLRPDLSLPVMRLHNGETIPFYDGAAPSRNISALTDQDKQTICLWGKAPDGTPSAYHNEDGSVITRAQYCTNFVRVFGDISDEKNRPSVISQRLLGPNGQPIEPAERVKPTANLTPMLCEGPETWKGDLLLLTQMDPTVMNVNDIKTLCFERDIGPPWYARPQIPSDLATFLDAWSPMRPIFDKMGNAIIMAGGQDHINALEFAWMHAWTNPGAYDWDQMRIQYEALAGMTFQQSAE